MKRAFFMVNTAVKIKPVQSDRLSCIKHIDYFRVITFSAAAKIA